MAKEAYEISLWGDKLVAAAQDIPAHYEEIRLATIGSDSMSSLSRALTPQLTENVNGTHSFSFQIRYYYIDPETGKSVMNPFINLLVNERKVKVKWKNDWYDFVIKQIDEDSANHTFTYTCQDQFINELSKTGFNLVFDTKLENNQGTAAELAERVLEGTDWSVNTAATDTIHQLSEDPVYQVLTSGSFSATKLPEKTTTATITSGKQILIFYSTIKNMFASGAQPQPITFLYDSSGNYDKYRTDSTMLLEDVPQYTFTPTSVTYSNNVLTVKSGSTTLFTVNSTAISNNYRGKRYVQSPRTEWDSIFECYAAVYKDSNNHIIHGFTKDSYSSPLVTTNLVANSTLYTNVNGWGDSTHVPTLIFYPPIAATTPGQDLSAQNYLKVTGAVANSPLYNSGLFYNIAYLPNGISTGQKFVVRYQIYTQSNNSRGSLTNTWRAALYEGTTQRSTSASISKVGDWYQAVITANKSFSKSQIATGDVKLGFYSTSNSTYWIKDIQFFEYSLGDDGSIITPTSITTKGILETHYIYYDYSQEKGKDQENVTLLYKGLTDWDQVGDNAAYTPQYNENCEKIRSITAKQSNRFNLLQSIAETFECWIKFHIGHNDNGTLIYTNGVPEKWISIHEVLGERAGYGFHYGIDVKQIQRQLDSNSIVTKTIVVPNVNEFAPNGACNIAAADNNYGKLEYVLNFDYYVGQGLLNWSEINNDLYLPAVGIGLYPRLDELNRSYLAKEELLEQYENQLLQLKSTLTVQKNLLSGAEEDKRNRESNLYTLTSKTNMADVQTFLASHESYEQAWYQYKVWCQDVEQISQLTGIVQQLEIQANDSSSGLPKYIADVKSEMEAIEEDIDAVTKEFNTKYASYIQEGSWTSQDYIDPNYYYYDAQSVAYESSRPQVSYNISVLRLTALDEYKSKVFHVGDISYIEDTEFFGYAVDGITPNREEVIISEMVTYFDEPQKDTVKIQNYKGNFEELFQRITATTQSLQYASGGYARAAAIVEADGTINVETLAHSMAINNQLAVQSQNQHIVSDSTGITVTDLTNPMAITRITANGIFISSDGGQTWKNAVRGEGIGTQYLTAGSINADQINIFDGQYGTFRWDALGLEAYSFSTDEQGNVNAVDHGKFIRYDRYGIYGLTAQDATDADWVPDSISDIKDNAAVGFGLTWDGFFLRSKDNNGRMELSSDDNAFIVYSGTGNNEVKRVQLGRDSGSSTYGLTLYNDDGDATLYQGSNGSLWLDKELNISPSTGSGYNIAIGYLDDTKPGASNIHETINVNDGFIVYEDGSIKGTNVELTGGTIGGVTIAEFAGSAYNVKIESSDGLVFKGDSGQKVLTATLYRGTTAITTGVTYQWYDNNSQISGATSRTYTVQNSSSYNGTHVYRCQVTYNGG